MEVERALNPKTKKKTENYLSKIDCKYCGLLCMFLAILLVQFVLHPTTTISNDGECYDKRETLLDSNGTHKITMCKEYLESRRYQSMSLQLSEKVYSFNQIEAQTLRYFLLWCPQQHKAVCSNYEFKIDKCYRAMKYKQMITCFNDRTELVYGIVGDVTLTNSEVLKLEQIVIYWF